jgi:hypothetical protein
MIKLYLFCLVCEVRVVIGWMGHNVTVLELAWQIGKWRHIGDSVRLILIIKVDCTGTPSELQSELFQILESGVIDTTFTVLFYWNISFKHWHVYFCFWVLTEAHPYFCICVEPALLWHSFINKILFRITYLRTIICLYTSYQLLFS